MTKSGPTDERRHEPADGLYWNESWYFDFSRADGTGGYVRLGLYPNQQVAWYWAYIVSPEHGLVVVRDHEVPLPRSEAMARKISPNSIEKKRIENIAGRPTPTQFRSMPQIAT